MIERALALTADLGPIEHLEVRALQGRPDWGDFLTAGWGGGVLFDLGVHPLAVALLAAAPADGRRGDGRPSPAPTTSPSTSTPMSSCASTPA